MPVIEGPVLVLGATSGIAREIALGLAEKGASLFLAGRDLDELERMSGDLRIRTGVRIETGLFDADEPSAHLAFYQDASAVMGGFVGAVLAIGYLGDQSRAQSDWQEAHAILLRNFVAAASVLHVIAAAFEKNESGWIVALSSVAGDRGRMSNYVYGSAKGGLAVFLQGLRSRLQKSDVHVLTVKPGPVDTAMTFGMSKLPLLAQPNVVGRAIVKALEKGKDVVYVPGPWRAIMFVLRSVPEAVFKKTRL